MFGDQINIREFKKSVAYMTLQNVLNMVRQFKLWIAVTFLFNFEKKTRCECIECNFRVNSGVKKYTVGLLHQTYKGMCFGDDKGNF